MAIRIVVTRNPYFNASNRIECYQILKNQLSVFQKLIMSETPEEANYGLWSLKKFMAISTKESRLKDVHNWIGDIHGSITAVLMHDYTRAELNELLKDLIESSANIIEKEKKAEEELAKNAEQLRKLFLKLANNPELITKLLETVD